MTPERLKEIAWQADRMQESTRITPTYIDASEIASMARALLTAYAERDQIAAERGRLKLALCHIAEPMEAFRRDVEASNGERVLDYDFALKLATSANYLSGLARAALEAK